MKRIRWLAVLACALLLGNCNDAPTSATPVADTVADVTFAKTTFESLARGDSSVANHIDWPVFTSLGQNLGADYTALSSGVEKEKFVTGFITQFAVSFRESGGRLEGFTNWRVVSHDSMKTEVAADSAGGILTVIVSLRDNVERVSSINVIE